MRALSLSVFFFLSQQVWSQHCPWDCSGLLMIRADLKAGELKKLDAVLVDGRKKLIVDTVYGTGVDSYDTCRLLYYDDFVAYRSSRIQLHHWYAFDTVYRFAKDHYTARFNYCKYRRGEDTTLFIRYKDPVSKEFRYTEIPSSRRIHLHDLNREIRERKTLAEIPSLEERIMVLGRKEWGLPEQ